jgi:hypothetical protein
VIDDQVYVPIRQSEHIPQDGVNVDQVLDHKELCGAVGQEAESIHNPEMVPALDGGVAG